MPYSADLYYQAYHQDDQSRVPLVLIHGAGGEHLSWPHQIRRLSGYRVFAPDLPGHGKSKGHGLQRISAYGERLKTWLEGLDLPKIFLAGHSMGGAIALWFAVQHPELLHGVAIISSGAQLPVNLSLFENLASPNSYPSAVEDICRWSFSNQADLKVINGVRNQLLKTRPTVLGADFRACDAFNISGELGKIYLPTLILVGDEDKMTPLKFSEVLRDGIHEAELEVIQGSGHMLPLEKPIEVAERLQSFFKAVQGG